MKNILLLVLHGLFLAVTGTAQEKCATNTLLENHISQHPEYAVLRAHQREHSKQQAESFLLTQPKMKTTVQVKIPVVFHVILTSTRIAQLGGTGLIVQRAIDQIAVLNEDFNRANNDRFKAPSAFAGLQGNLEITFGLAHRDPTGASTSGIEIKTTTLNGFSAFSNNGSDAKFVTTGGLDAWDPNKYLNIWIVDITESGLLGYCVPPSFMSFQYSILELGVVIDYGAFGRRGNGITFFSPATNDRGRTGTHEVAHFFELEHTFGNNASCPGSGDVDDMIADTPPQGDAVYGSPTFPRLDACSPSSPGLMFMNFMDYTDDTAMYMFTLGQGSFVQSKLTSGVLKSVTEHPEILDWPTSIANVPQENLFQIYPNPSSGKFEIHFSDARELLQIVVLNTVGQIVYTALPETLNSNTLHVDLTGQSSGVYLVRCAFTSGTVSGKIILQ